ncbi:MAG: TVP38/TMEM64 family protein [Bacilli bacterium]|nr:TVP38/TMEM64 family protein [Bacilli bacterium]
MTGLLENISEIIDQITIFMQDGGIICGIFLILLESIIPVLPLGVFIAMNINAYGFILGFVISWLTTCFGCFLSYTLFRFIGTKLLKLLSKKDLKRIKKGTKRIRNLEFSNLVLLIALPFTPAFLINIIAGLSNVPRKKFMAAILLGKLFIVYFWGFIGKSFIESMSDVRILISIVVILVIAYIFSKIVAKKFDLE